MNENGLMTRAEAGKLGGRAHLRKYSRDHFRMIGIKGGLASAAKRARIAAEKRKVTAADEFKNGSVRTVVRQRGVD